MMCFKLQQLICSLAAGRPHVALMTVIKLLCFSTLKAHLCLPRAALQQVSSIARDCGSRLKREIDESVEIPAPGTLAQSRLIAFKLDGLKTGALYCKQLATRPISNSL